MSGKECYSCKKVFQAHHSSYALDEQGLKCVHASCYACMECGVPLNANNGHICNMTDRLLCTYCLMATMPPTCAVCSIICTKESYKVNGLHYHTDCWIKLQGNYQSRQAIAPMQVFPLEADPFVWPMSTVPSSLNHSNDNMSSNNSGLSSAMDLLNKFYADLPFDLNPGLNFEQSTNQTACSVNDFIPIPISQEANLNIPILTQEIEKSLLEDPDTITDLKSFPITQVTNLESSLNKPILKENLENHSPQESKSLFQAINQTVFQDNHNYKYDQTGSNYFVDQSNYVLTNNATVPIPQNQSNNATVLFQKQQQYNYNRENVANTPQANFQPGHDEQNAHLHLEKYFHDGTKNQAEPKAVHVKQNQAQTSFEEVQNSYLELEKYFQETAVNQKPKTISIEHQEVPQLPNSKLFQTVKAETTSQTLSPETFLKKDAIEVFRDKESQDPNHSLQNVKTQNVLESAYNTHPYFPSQLGSYHQNLDTKSLTNISGSKQNSFPTQSVNQGQIQTKPEKQMIPQKASNKIVTYQVINPQESANAECLYKLVYETEVKNEKNIPKHPVTIIKRVLSNINPNTQPTAPKRIQSHPAQSTISANKENVAPQFFRQQLAPVALTYYSSNYNSGLPRSVIKPEYQTILKEAFKKDQFPDRAERVRLGVKCQLKPRQVQIWFQNQRSKRKRRSREFNARTAVQRMPQSTLVQPTL